MTGAGPWGTKVTVSLTLAPPAEVPTPTPTATPDCARTSELCQWIYQHTGQTWLASGSYYFLLKPAQIVLILILATVARYLMHRTINRLVHTTTVE